MSYPNFSIRTISDELQWTQYFTAINTHSFMQSWEWGELQEHMGHGVSRVAFFEEDTLIGIAQIIKMRSRRGNLLFVPHGPLFVVEKLAYIQFFIEYLRDIGRKEKYWFIRIAPLILDTPTVQQQYRELGFHHAPLYLTAENSWVLSLEKSEDELLQEMRKTTRYSIKRAIKDGGIVEWRTDDEAIDEFWVINKQTVEREKFTPFSQRFTLEELRVFRQRNNVAILLGKIQGSSEVLAGALILFTESSGFYHQGASIHSKVPLTYLIQWEAIKEAKRRGCRLYNFWGIAPNDSPTHPWSGLTAFKKGFGGYQLNYLPEQDVSLSPLYWGTYLFETYVHLKRGV